MTPLRFHERAGDAAAYLVAALGAPASAARLSTGLYLLERRMVEARERAFLDDEPTSLPDRPALARVEGLCQGRVAHVAWSSRLARDPCGTWRPRTVVGARGRPVPACRFMELTRRSRAALDAVAGDLAARPLDVDLAAWARWSCAEWDADGGPIGYVAMAEALGLSDPWLTLRATLERRAAEAAYH